MFNNVGWGELLILAVIGLVVLGPERLPKAAADAARMLRQLRAMARNATADLKAELGPEMADLDLASLHPRRMVQSMLLDDDDVSAVGAATPVGRPGQVPLQPGEPPPYDADAT
jgi:sec-independent protein translocase protein TatB